MNEEISRLLRKKENAIVFLNGKFSEKFSATDNIKDDCIISIDTAGVNHIKIKQNALISEPVYLIFFADSQGNKINTENKIINTENKIIAGKNSKSSFIEINAGTGNYISNTTTGIVLEDGANLDHAKIQIESLTAGHSNTTNAVLNRNSNYQNFALNLGGKNSKNAVNVKLTGEHSSAFVNGLYVQKADQENENIVFVNHANSETKSEQLYKGILDGKCRTLFDGKILVDRNLQKVFSSQTNKNLLLSKNARVLTRPHLEIKADDVKCTHGATVGQLSEEQCFYLESRGFSKETARIMLREAFANDVVVKISNPFIREYVAEVIGEMN